MALGSALVDRARRIVKEPATSRVEGTTIFEDVPGPWFRCRLFLTGDPESDDDQRSRRRTPRRPTLLVGRRDTEGNVIELRADERLEVNSPQLGRAVWHIDGEPEPLRRRRSVIGWQVAVSRVVEHEFENEIFQRTYDTGGASASVEAGGTGTVA